MELQATIMGVKVRLSKLKARENIGSNHAIIAKLQRRLVILEGKQ